MRCYKYDTSETNLWNDNLICKTALGLVLPGMATCFIHINHPKLQAVHLIVAGYIIIV